MRHGKKVSAMHKVIADMIAPYFLSKQQGRE